MVGFVTNLKPQYLTGIGQKIQVPVDGAETDVRHLCPHGGINLIGGRMILPGGKIRFNFFSLPTVFTCHIVPFLKVVTVTVITIRHVVKKVNCFFDFYLILYFFKDILRFRSFLFTEKDVIICINSVKAAETAE